MPPAPIFERISYRASRVPAAMLTVDSPYRARSQRRDDVAWPKSFSSGDGHTHIFMGVGGCSEGPRHSILFGLTKLEFQTASSETSGVAGAMCSVGSGRQFCDSQSLSSPEPGVMLTGCQNRER